MKKSLTKVSKASILEIVSEACDFKRKPLLFADIKPLKRLSLDNALGLFSPNSIMAIVSVGNDPAAVDFMIGLGVSCAKEGPSVLFLSRNIGFEEFASRIYSIIANGHYSSLRDNTSSLADIKLIDALKVYHESLDVQGGCPASDTILSSIESCDADLLILEGGNCSDVNACMKAARKQGIPLMYNRPAFLEGRRVIANGFAALPTHILLMDRSLDEIEAEQSNRPYMGVRECRLMLPSEQKHAMMIPFLGTFQLIHSSENHRIGHLVDEYDGHMLSAEIDEIELDGELYAIIEPNHYKKSLNLLYGGE